MCDSASEGGPAAGELRRMNENAPEIHGIMFGMVPGRIVGGLPRIRYICACGWASSTFKGMPVIEGPNGEPIVPEGENQKEGQRAQDELVAHLVEACHPADADAAATVTVGVRALLPAIVIMAGRLTNTEAALQALQYRIQQGRVVMRPPRPS